MKNLGLTSRFALLGIHLAICCLLFAFFLKPTAPAPTEYGIVTFAQEIEFATSERVEMEMHGSKLPCFTVTVDPTVYGAGVDYRNDLFGAVHLSNQEVLAKELEAALLQDFTDKVWELSDDCVEGTFVVSFPVDEQGKIGKTMLVHHPTGAAQQSALSVLRVLVRMRDEGFVWTDSQQATTAGEIRVPLRFRIG